MCKHIQSTVVDAMLLDGTPLRIHQCDMCGLPLPGRAVEETHVDPMEMDWEALRVALDKVWTPLVRDMKDRRLVGGGV